MKKRRRRIYLTHAEKAVMWDRWKQGESLHAILVPALFAAILWDILAMSFEIS